MYKLLWAFAAIPTILLIQCQPKTAAGDESMSGQEVYEKYCLICHGAKGNMQQNGAKNLRESVLPLSERITVIKHGRGMMVGYGNILTDAQIEKVAAYTLSLSDDPSQIESE